MKTIFLVAVLLTSTLASATEISCNGGRRMNGLGIMTLDLYISDEDPDAFIDVQYRSGLQVHSTMSYEGTDTAYDFMPSGSKDGDLSVVLVQKNGKWLATVTAADTDTFSRLNCIEK